MPADLRYDERRELPREQVLALYSANRWTAYTRDPDLLLRAIAGSHTVVSAWEGDRLVGLARVVSDGASIAYLQDVLVLPDLQRMGIGRGLVERAFAPYAHIRQHVLLTDGSPQQRAFYVAVGFVAVTDLEPPVRAFVRFKA